MKCKCGKSATWLGYSQKYYLDTGRIGIFNPIFVCLFCRQRYSILKNMEYQQCWVSFDELRNWKEKKLKKFFSNREEINIFSFSGWRKIIWKIRKGR